MKIDATVFEARLREAEARLREAAAIRSSTEANSIGGTGLKVQPEAIQMLKSADDLRALADEIAELARA